MNGEDAAPLQRTNRELSLLCSCNQILVRANDEQTLLDGICRIACADGGYRAAWVGLIAEESPNALRVAAHDGLGDGSLFRARFTWPETEQEPGPTGRALRNKRPIVIDDLATELTGTPWREEALKQRCRSGIALPLLDQYQHVLGVLSVYATESERFVPREVAILQDVARAVSFGLVSIRAAVAQRHTNVRLRESEMRFRTLVEQAGDGFEVLDAEGRFVDVNSATCRHLGYSKDELLGLSIADVDMQVNLQQLTSTFQSLLDRPPITFETVYRRKDGTTFPAEVITSVIRIGNVPRTLMLVRDVTARKRA